MSTSTHVIVLLFVIFVHRGDSYNRNNYRSGSGSGSYDIQVYGNSNVIVTTRYNLKCWLKAQLEKKWEELEASQGNRAVAVLQGTGVNGTVWFTQKRSSDPCVISGIIYGLTPGYHGFHVHQYGDLTKGCISTGGHYNPFNKTHGGPMDENRHVGDLGTVVADEYGVARFNITDNMVKIHGKTSVIGRAVVVHAHNDDLGKGMGDKRNESLKTGNAGPRMACGVIGIAPKN